MIGVLHGAGETNGHVVVRALGPSLAGAGIADPLLDPVVRIARWFWHPRSQQRRFSPIVVAANEGARTIVQF